MSASVPLKRLARDPEAWPRAQLDDERVAEFMELYEAGGLTALPPVLVIERADDYLVADGWHRCQALANLGIEDVLVEIVPSTGRDPVAVAYEIGLRSSATASKSLTRAEKQAAVLHLTVEGGRTDQEIAELVGVARTTVGRIRAREGTSHAPASPVGSPFRLTPLDLDKVAATGATAPAQGADGGDASHEIEDDEYVPIADEIAHRIVHDLWELWNARGVTDRYYRRLPRNLADVLHEAYEGDDPLIWARRIATWATDAVERLEQEAGNG